LDVEQRENALYISNNNANMANNLPLPPPTRAPIVKKGSDISSPNERQPMDGAVCQGPSEIITEQTPPPPSSNNAQQPTEETIKLDKFGNEINPEKDKVALNAFLTNPSGMNWEDLVRSMKKKTGLEALVGQELVTDSNDDDVSDLDADPQEDEGSYKYTGDLSCMGNILSNYMRRKKSEGTVKGHPQQHSKDESKSRDAKKRKDFTPPPVKGRQHISIQTDDYNYNNTDTVVSDNNFQAKLSTLSMEKLSMDAPTEEGEEAKPTGDAATSCNEEPQKENVPP